MVLNDDFILRMVQQNERGEIGIFARLKYCLPGTIIVGDFGKLTRP
jgi:hypothetical protein